MDCVIVSFYCPRDVGGPRWRIPVKDCEALRGFTPGTHFEQASPFPLTSDKE